jgi:single-stranded-DNA-specific exonuclease
MKIVTREVPDAARNALIAGGVHPVLARLFASRGVETTSDLGQELADLLPPAGLRGIADAATRLAKAADDAQPVLVVADYDCDGATACAVAVRGLRMLGLQVDYLVPNRFEHGYGLTPAIVDLAATHPRLGKPALLITVDNGIASIDGVERATRSGIDVLITDHHLPGEVLPAATAIVNPNQPDCEFVSKNLAGVGVMFYVLLALRALMRKQGYFSSRPEPQLQSLLDLVALGTVADLVRLDRNNRLLVAAGLRRIRGGAAQPGIAALFAVAGRDARKAACTDLGFSIGPRINAAGRLSDITIGIECLLAEDSQRAHELATLLDEINRKRREIETRMRDQALDDVTDIPSARRTLVVHRDTWHEGVVGLVASRLKERLHRPVVAFAAASAEPGMLRGSGRSIPGVHLRDMLDLVSKRAPGLITRFGGHAMAAGMTMPVASLARFEQEFEQAVAQATDPAMFDAQLFTDGSLAGKELELSLVDEIEQQVWGQGFPPPLFSDTVQVLSQRLINQRHLRAELLLDGRRIAAIAFGRTQSLPSPARIAYRLLRDDYRGLASVQLAIEAVEAAQA